MAVCPCRRHGCCGRAVLARPHVPADDRGIGGEYGADLFPQCAESKKKHPCYLHHGHDLQYLLFRVGWRGKRVDRHRFRGDRSLPV